MMHDQQIIKLFNDLMFIKHCTTPVSVAALFNAWVYGCSSSEIVGSNPSGEWMFVVSVVCYQVAVSATS
jgi:hypothetical protein